MTQVSLLVNGTCEFSSIGQTFLLILYNKIYYCFFDILIITIAPKMHAIPSTAPTDGV